MSITIRRLEHDDVEWIIDRHVAVYAEEQPALATGDFAGTSFAAVVTRIVTQFRDGHEPQREAGWMATVDGNRAGCVYCLRREATIAQLRLLFVDSPFRGRGVGDALVAECMAFARAAGYDTITLLTNESQTAARRLYERAGFRFTRRDDTDGPAGQLWMTADLGSHRSTFGK